jgi:hypothetical protein
VVGQRPSPNGAIPTANGEVTLDLRPAITRLQRLGEDKLRRDNRPPQEIVLMKSDQLGAAQTAVKILKALAVPADRSVRPLALL